MRRYVQISDIRDTRSWQHHASARLYMYMCMTCSWDTGLWSGTRRRVALELGLTDQEYRTAIKNLTQDGLIDPHVDIDAGALPPPTQGATQRATQRVTQRATQVTVVIYRDLGGGTSPKGQPKEQPKEQPSGQPQNNNNKNNKTYSLPLARMRAPELVDDVAAYIHSGRQDAVAAIRAFLDTMGRKRKTWLDEGDYIAHLMDWSLHNWMRVDSRYAAANKSQERAERQAAQQKEPTEKEAKEAAARYKIDWLMHCPQSSRARELVSAWASQGAFDQEPLKSMTRALLSEKSELKEYLTK